MHIYINTHMHVYVFVFCVCALVCVFDRHVSLCAILLFVEYITTDICYRIYTISLYEIALSHSSLLHFWENNCLSKRLK